MTESNEALSVAENLGNRDDDLVIRNDNTLHDSLPTEYNARKDRA